MSDEELNELHIDHLDTQIEYMKKYSATLGKGITNKSQIEFARHISNRVVGEDLRDDIRLVMYLYSFFASILTELPSELNKSIEIFES